MARTDPYAAALDRLAEQLRTTSDFLGTFDLFERTLGLDAGFLGACRPSTSPLLEAALAHVAPRLDRSDAQLRWLTPVMRYRPQRFVHGAAMVGCVASIAFYFEERGLGLVVAHSAGKTHAARLSALDLPSSALRMRGRGQA